MFSLHPIYFKFTFHQHQSFRIKLEMRKKRVCKVHILWFKCSDSMMTLEISISHLIFYCHSQHEVSKHLFTPKISMFPTPLPTSNHWLNINSTKTDMIRFKVTKHHLSVFLIVDFSAALDLIGHTSSFSCCLFLLS